MTDSLSPAVKAVDRAIADRIQLLGEVAPSRQVAAAALRAAVQQVVPEQVNSVGDEHDEARREQWKRIRLRFLAIADELEALPND
jgi:hypothetical protein